ncbi:hypothetical protein C4588_06475 [Candidatus Parcubacteria bacterium]|nr:MAG: hypothetical protein C4588_06475 [Candidatus Parcubacteria bacterium]
MAKKHKKARKGNFRRVTPAVAERYLRRWAKKGVTRADDIPASKNSDYEKIRWREAQAVMRNYERRVDEHKAALERYKQQLQEYKALKGKKVFVHSGLPAKYLAPKKPATPKKTDCTTPRCGNFKPVNKKQAKNYLKRLFNYSKQGLDDLMPLAHLSGAKADKFTPRIQEATLKVGLTEAADLWLKAEVVRAKRAQAAAEKAKKAEERKYKVNATKLAKFDKLIEKAKARLEELEKKRKALTSLVVASRRRRRMKRRSRSRSRSRARARRR